MTSSTWARSSLDALRRPWIFWGILIAIAAAALGSAVANSTAYSLTADNRQYMAAAYNLANHQVFSPDDSADPQPGYRRDAAYSAVMAVLFWGPLRTVSQTCVASGPECAPLRKAFGAANAVFFAALVLLMGFAVFYLTGSRPAGIAAAILIGLVRWFDFSVANPEIFAGLVVAVHCLGLAVAFRAPTARGRMEGALLGGIALGVLVLTKAIFLYWLYLLIVGAIIAAWRLPQARALVACFILPAMLIAGAWAARNAYEFGDFAVSGRDGEILEIRAAFLDMTWPEYAAGFAFYAPPTLGPIRGELLKVLPNSDRFLRSNANGFYQLGKHPTGVVAATQTERDAKLMQMAKTKILEQPFKYAAQSVLFAWSLAFPHPSNFRSGNIVLAVAYIIPLVVGALAALVAGVSLIVLAVRALLRRDWGLAAFCMPALFSWAIYAVGSHAIPRYGVPVSPILIASVVINATFLLAQRRARRSNRISANPVEEPSPA